MNADQGIKASELPSWEEHFEKVPRWSAGKGKRFDVIADSISGRIPVTRLERWQEFTDLVEDPFFNQASVHFVFRGHRRYDWGLSPTLGRLSENGIVTEALAAEQLSKFRRAIRGRIDDRSMLELVDDTQQCDELWAVGQHHGLMTPLLDWTYSPYVALFFAFAKSDVKGETDNPYRAVYLLNKTFVENDDLCPEIRVLEPRKDDYGRLVNQAGLFTFSPYDSTIENKLSDVLSSPEFSDDSLRNAAEDEQPTILAKYICKIYIPNHDREGCLKHLRRMNVHHASLFPDVLGAAEYCNTLITEERSTKRNDGKPLLPAAKEDILETGSSLSELSAQIEMLLHSPQIDPARRKQLLGEMEGILSVGDATNEARIARLREILPVTLRRYNFPPEFRAGVVEQLMRLNPKRVPGK